MLIMAINDFVWVIFWVLFFDRVGTLGGWDRDSIILLQAVLTTAGGLSLGLFANARSIGTMAVGGDLDAVLALPVRPLRFVLLRRINPVNLGDLAFGIALFFVACEPTPERTVIFVLVSLASATLLTGFLVLTGRAGVLHRSQRERRARLPRHAAARRLSRWTCSRAASASSCSRWCRPRSCRLFPRRSSTTSTSPAPLQLGLAAAVFATLAASHLHRRSPPLHQRQHLDPR